MVAGSSISNGNKPARSVAFVHDTNIYGGVEVFLLLLIQHLDPKRYTPVVLVPGYTDSLRGSPARFIQQVKGLGLPLVNLPVRLEKTGLGLIRQIQKTVQIFEDLRLDVVHIHTCRPSGARISTVSAWLAGIPALLRT